jgi:hypothetical protein
LSRESEAYMPLEMVERVLASATQDLVLVGGQALAFWMDRYDIRQPADLPAVSRDVDFFTRDAANANPLANFAKAIGGRAEVEDHRSITALIGSAVAPAPEDRVYNVDLLHAVVGLDRESVQENSIEVAVPGGRTKFRVMHPLDVLKSRNANLHLLADKRDAIGQLQLRLAIDVARKFLEGQIDGIGRAKAVSTPDRERAILKFIGVVAEYAKEDAAKKNAKRYGIFLADAIPAWRISSPGFWEKEWPHLRGRMSPAYADQCEAQARPRKKPRSPRAP